MYEDNVMNAVVALAVPHTLPLARLMHIAPDRRYRCDDALSIGSVECEVAEVQIVCAPARATTGGGRTPFAFRA